MKKGFSLSEILITLGIIGVVAALTMPTILSNIEKARTVAVLKRAYSDLSNLVVSFDNEYDCNSNFAMCTPANLEFRNKFSEYLIEKHGFNQLAYNDWSFFINHKLFNRDQKSTVFHYVGGYTLIPKSGNYILNIGNNMIDNTYTATISGKRIYIRASAIIVTNPKHYYKKDYKLRTGRDIFFAFILNNGRVIPGGSPYCPAYFCTNYKKDLTCNPENKPESVDAYESKLGYGCLQRIIDDGWQIKY